MNCLYCGKELEAKDEITGWHKRCIKHFFGTSEMPSIEVNDDTLEQLAEESTNKGYTIPGVQKKLSLHLSKGTNPRLTLVNFPTGYILKPQVKEFVALPEAEQLAMSMAAAAGIAVVPHALIRSGENLSYITKRIDRNFTRASEPEMLAMEDFCQLDLRLTQDKYKGSYERCAKIIEKYSSRRGLDTAELFMRLVFSFVIGNSDMHLKNFSMLEESQGSASYILSPAYDLLPVNIIMPEDTEQFALAINGKKNNIRKKDFLIFAGNCGISEISAEKMIAKIVSQEQKFIEMCEKSFLPQGMKEMLAELIADRNDILKN